MRENNDVDGVAKSDLHMTAEWRASLDDAATIEAERRLRNQRIAYFAAGLAGGVVVVILLVKAVKA